MGMGSAHQTLCVQMTLNYSPMAKHHSYSSRAVERGTSDPPGNKPQKSMPKGSQPSLSSPKTALFAKQSQFLLCRSPKNKANSKPNKPIYKPIQSQYSHNKPKKSVLSNNAPDLSRPMRPIGPYKPYSSLKNVKPGQGQSRRTRVKTSKINNKNGQYHAEISDFNYLPFALFAPFAVKKFFATKSSQSFTGNPAANNETTLMKPASFEFKLPSFDSGF